MFIWCPNTRDECGIKIIPIPKSCFLIFSSEEIKVNLVSKTIVDSIEKICDVNTVDLRKAEKKEDEKNILCKICEMIQASSFGIVLYTKYTPKESIPNIFYESGLMHAFGKDIILIGYEIKKRPSDIRDLEWILTKNRDDLEKKLDSHIKNILQKFGFFISAGQIEEDSKNYEKVVEYYTKAGLLSDSNSDIDEVIKNLDSISKSIEEFDMLPNLKKRIKTFKKFIKKT